VTEVAPGSAGAAAGIRPGDAILEVNRKPVSDAEALRQVVAGLKPGESVPVYLQRGGGANEYVVLTAPRP
jgi:S1-C subfamily serine protease